jgi:hypothetical protein
LVFNLIEWRSKDTNKTHRHKYKTQNTKRNKTKKILQEKRNVEVLGQNPNTLKPGNKSLIKSGLQLNVQLPLVMPLAAEAHLAE